MSLSLRRVTAATAGALAVALTLGTASPALAQTASIDPSTLDADDLANIIDLAGAIPVGSVVGVAGSVGSADFPVGETFPNPPSYDPTPVDPEINTSEFLGIDSERAPFEIWKVTSAAMQRVIYLEVLPSQVTDQGAAPVLYLLDGVGTGLKSTGWRNPGDVESRLAGENVHVIAPAGGNGSYFSDWNNEDPKLGNHKWETFLTEELPGIVEERLTTGNGYAAGTNGKNGIGGISMGAQSAMHLASAHPDVYDAVMSFSGYYSTMDELGYQSVRGAVESVGGNLDNMWGPKGSARWKDHDTISRPRTLKDTRVYFSAGAPVPGPEDFAHYGADFQNILVGLLLESGALEGAKAFSKALDRAGVEHRVDYTETGLHNWPNFMQNFANGWNYIKPALNGDDIDPGTEDPDSSGSAGSTGSTGSSGSVGSTGS